MLKSQYDKKDVAGVVVLFNSSDNIVMNIDSYINQVEQLYVVDNSPIKNYSLINKLYEIYPTIKYKFFGKNIGIGGALNWAAHKSIEDGFSFLLTMDDDTSVPINMVNQLIEFINNYDRPIGILSGLHHDKLSHKSYKRVLYTLTSGNLLNLEAFSIVGDFREDYIIDHVDHEFGLRLNKYDFDVVSLSYIRLKHKLGYRRQILFASIVIREYGSHSPLRYYYFARNGLYTAKIYFFDYPIFIWMISKEIIKRFIKALLFDDNRKVRITLLFRGIKDGLKSKLGPIENVKTPMSR